MLGIDLSRAFDTIDRAKLLEIVRPLTDQDEYRMIISLPSGSSAKVRVAGMLSSSFNLDIGSPQGDGLGPVLFIVYLETCLKEVRQKLPPRPLSDINLVEESQYADDCDLCGTSIEWLKEVSDIISTIFEQYGFAVNRDKTEWVEIYGPNTWRTIKKLGSSLDDHKDADRRMVLASLAFNSFNHLWNRKSTVTLARKMKIYNAFVLPLLTYNCANWGFSDLKVQKMSAFHRRHLRKILGIRWPDTISNTDLCARLGTFSLGNFVKNARLRLLGHVLRLPRDAPAQRAMDLYFSDGKRHRGRPTHLLPTRIAKDVGKFGHSFKTGKDLADLREMASDRERWKSTVFK